VTDELLTGVDAFLSTSACIQYRLTSPCELKISIVDDENRYRRLAKRVEELEPVVLKSIINKILKPIVGKLVQNLPK